MATTTIITRHKIARMLIFLPSRNWKLCCSCVKKWGSIRLLVSLVRIKNLQLGLFLFTGTELIFFQLFYRTYSFSCAFLFVSFSSTHNFCATHSLPSSHYANSTTTSWYDGSLKLQGCEDLMHDMPSWPWVDFIRCQWPSEHISKKKTLFHRKFPKPSLDLSCPIS